MPKIELTMLEEAQIAYLRNWAKNKTEAGDKWINITPHFAYRLASLVLELLDQSRQDVAGQDPLSCIAPHNGGK